MITPGPGEYRNECNYWNIIYWWILIDNKCSGAQKGGTGQHSGFVISFTKDKRHINQEVEKKSYIPGPGQY